MPDNKKFTMTHFLASGFGSGYLPYMPGTWGSVVGMLMAWFLKPFGAPGFLIATIFTSLLGWKLSHQLIKTHPVNRDPSYIVIDEIAGLFLTYCFIDWVMGGLSTLAWGMGFLLFRIFDIWKPFPIGWVDKKLAASVQTAGLGVMLDDLLAAIPAAAITILVLFL